MPKTNFSGIAFAVLIMVVLLPIRSWAQDNVNSYKVGEKVEYRDRNDKTDWFEGTIVSLSPRSEQVVIRLDPRAGYEGFTHNGVNSFEQAYNMDSVRHLKRRTADKPDDGNVGDNVNSYKVGEKVEYRDRNDKTDWFEGTIVRVSPRDEDVVVRLDPRAGYEGFTHNGVNTFEAGFSMDCVRHIKRRTADKPGDKNGGDKDDPDKTRPDDTQGGARKVGDKVEFWNITWYDGTIIEIGSGTNRGNYRVRWDKGSSTGGEWVSAKHIRARQTTATPDTGGGPRAGKYTIRSYGDVTNAIVIGYFVLSGSRYQYLSVTGETIGSGGYTYDAGASEVKWTSGPFKDAGWTGKFKIDREGKTHTIQLNFVTFADNSTDD